MSGLLHPKTGDVLYKGKSIKGVRAHKIVEAGLAQVPEGRHVFLHMTVEENLDMGAYTQPNSTIAPNKEKVFELFPRLKERRKQLAKEVSKMGEEAKVAVRNVRRDAMDKAKAMKKAGELTEDTQKTMEEEVQKLTDKYIKNIDAAVEEKQKEIMSV